MWDYMFDWIVQKMEPKSVTDMAARDSQRPPLRVGGRLCLGAPSKRILV